MSKSTRLTDKQQSKPFVDDILFMLKSGVISSKVIQEAWGVLLRDYSFTHPAGTEVVRGEREARAKWMDAPWGEKKKDDPDDPSYQSYWDSGFD